VRHTFIVVRTAAAPTGRPRTFWDLSATEEVISRSSIQRDREEKPRACALAGIPLYLLVDRFTKPMTISLHSVPGKDGYARVTTVIAGEKLQLPAPFDLTLDTSSLPLPA
jgi:hypothetical protein